MKKILTAMSGGVDSAVSAFLLINSGYNVTGATFFLHDKGENEVRDAKSVCDFLGIPHITLDFSTQFEEHVVKPFVSAYEGGRTPNPCVDCNKHIKFGAFWRYALEAGFNGIATGHYARVTYDGDHGLPRLRKGGCDKKDQSYVLYNLTQEILRNVVFPISEMSKDDVRRAARENGLPVHCKSDSQDICFIPDGDYGSVVEGWSECPMPPGHFLDSSGKILGCHMGIYRYTIGQRKGLGISLGRPAFVTGIDPGRNAVVLGDDSELWKRELTARSVNWISPPTDREFRASAKIRYSHKEADAAITLCNHGCVRVVFDNPQRAITPGQSVVFYQGDEVLGGGVISG